MSTQSPPALTREYAQKAVQSPQKAMDGETNNRVMHHFRSRVEIYKVQEKHPPAWKQMRELEMNSSSTNDR